MRPFVFDFPGDEEALRQTGSYMFGKSILVSPVMDGGVTELKVYLPENESGWYDWWTGKKFDGGQYVNAKAGIETIPVYVKGGSIIPTGPQKQFVAQKVDEPVVLNIYPGADASFTLYADEGTNYNYENGAYSNISLSWDDAARSLTIGKREGSFKGMDKTMTFAVNLMGEVKNVEYSGNETTIRF